MKTGFIASHIQKILNGFKFESLADIGRPPAFFGKVDAGVLQVAMAIAALDGQVTDSELEAFEKLAKKCRGYNAESVKAVFREGLRIAGYLELASRVFSAKELQAEFLEEAKRLLPDKFISEDFPLIRRAFVMWIAMAMSDGTYSPTERTAILGLAKYVKDCLNERSELNARRQSLSPSFAVAYREGGVMSCPLFSKQFFERAESLIAKLNSGTPTARAVADLKNFILKGE